MSSPHIFIKVVMGGKIFEAMIDTGSNYTIIDKKLLNIINYKYLGNPISVCVANRTISRMSHIRTTISIGNIYTPVVVGVLEPFACDILLGLNAIDIIGLRPFQQGNPLEFQRKKVSDISLLKVVQKHLLLQINSNNTIL